MRPTNFSKLTQQFLCWDGEGASVDHNLAQDYILFGNSSGDYICNPRNLSTTECLDFILEQDKKYPNRIHVGFAFTYDVNQILQDLSPYQWKRLKEGPLNYHDYRIEFLPGKWFIITEYNSRRSVTIYDVFSFFQTTFINAVNDYIPNSKLLAQREILESGKKARNNFTHDNFDTILEYWKLEIKLFQELIEELRYNLYSAELYITSWHGPGAIANYIYKHKDMGKHFKEPSAEIIDASRYAYAGGRFEHFRMGKTKNVWSIDINSAYPYAISKLPSLEYGEWRYVKSPKTIVQYGVYHINFEERPRLNPAPLFHRDRLGRISYPWKLEGWYWSPEVVSAMQYEGCEIIEGWEFIPDFDSKPFAWVEEMYHQRKVWKKQGNAAQRGLKLALNSLYGKMAQRSGYKIGGKKPAWHNLCLAGYVTSYTRAKLFQVMSRIPVEHLLGVETDGIYLSIDPATIGITEGDNLGEWEISKYDEMIYLQNGIYLLKCGDKITMKYRGLDKGTLTYDDFVNCADNNLMEINGTTTRFITHTQALARSEQGENKEKFLNLHRRWITTEKNIQFGRTGKRVHITELCDKCNGADVDTHNLYIFSLSILEEERFSTRHDIPWIDDTDGPLPWRETMEDDAY